MTQQPHQPGLLTARLGVTVVALTAAVISFSHVQHLARSAGEPELTAWLLPLSIDGAIAAAAAVVLADSKAHRRPTALTWMMLALGLAASLAANIASAQSTWTARAVAAWPPIALALGIEVLASMSRRAREPEESRPAPAEQVPTHAVSQASAAPPPSRPASDQLHLVDQAVDEVPSAPPPPARPDDQEAVELIRRLDQATPDGQASRRTIQEQLQCGSSRAARLAALARTTTPGRRTA